MRTPEAETGQRESAKDHHQKSKECIMRERATLKVFEQHVLPGLVEKFRKEPEPLAKLNQCIKNNWSIYDPNDNNRPVTFSVGGSPFSSDSQVVDQKAIDSRIEKVVNDALREMEHTAKIKAAPAIAAIAASYSGNFNHMDNTLSFGRKHKPVNFKGADAERKAFRWGCFALAAMGKSQKAMNWCEANGVSIKSGGSVEGTNTLGGVLVPDELDNDIIDLRVEYGVFRRNARNRSMKSDHRNIPRRAGGLSAYFVGESEAGTSSQKLWNSVGLTAKKIMVLSLMSSELSEDAVIEVGDDLAGEVAYAFSTKEDQCGFVGDGTSTYGGIDGIVPKLITINGVDDGGGIVVATGNAWSEITIGDLRRTIGRTPSYARKNAKWYCSPRFCDEVIFKLIDAAGGNTVRDLQAERGLQALGYPIELAETMTSTEANSTIPCLFGDLRQSSAFGDRRETTITFSISGTVDGVDLFATDQIGIRGTERFDIVNHDLGDATTAGPVVGLMTASA
jgi:HK97 family phage major capsid protein